MGVAAQCQGFDFTDVFAHSQPNKNTPTGKMKLPLRDGIFSIANGGYGETPCNEMPVPLGPLGEANLPTIGSKRDQGEAGVDWRISQSQAKILESLKSKPLGPNETLTLMGGSGGSVVIAQTALKMANEGQVIDNLVLLASPVPRDSRLFEALSSNENIKRILYIDLEGDDITDLAGNLQKIGSLYSEMKRLGEYHPHVIITWNKNLPIMLFQSLQGDHHIEEKGREGVIDITIPYKDIKNEKKY